MRSTKTIYLRMGNGKVRWRLVDIVSGAVLLSGEAKNEHHAKQECHRRREGLVKG